MESRHEINNDVNENDVNPLNISKKIIGRTPVDNNTLDGEVVVPLKYFSNFGRFFDLSLINCEIELDLLW